jgi:hypothetical protein
VARAASGSIEEIQHGSELAATDWRDVLMNGGPQHEDWATELDLQRGPDDSP